MIILKIKTILQYNLNLVYCSLQPTAIYFTRHFSYYVFGYLIYFIHFQLHHKLLIIFIDTSTIKLFKNIFDLQIY